MWWKVFSPCGLKLPGLQNGKKKTWTSAAERIKQPPLCHPGALYKECKSHSEICSGQSVMIGVEKSWKGSVIVAKFITKQMEGQLLLPVSTSQLVLGQKTNPESPLMSQLHIETPAVGVWVCVSVCRCWHVLLVLRVEEWTQLYNQRVFIKTTFCQMRFWPSWASLSHFWRLVYGSVLQLDCIVGGFWLPGSHSCMMTLWHWLALEISFKGKL